MDYWKIVFQGSDIGKEDDIAIDFNDIVFKLDKKDQVLFDGEILKEFRKKISSLNNVLVYRNIKTVWDPLGIEINKYRTFVLMVGDNTVNNIEMYIFILTGEKKLLLAGIKTESGHLESDLKPKELQERIMNIFNEPQNYEMLHLITPWLDQYEVTLEGKDAGTEDDVVLPFYAVNPDDYPSLRLSFLYKVTVTALGRENYQLIENIKKLRDPKGNEIDLDANYYLIVSGNVKNEDAPINMLYYLQENKRLELVGVYPEELLQALELDRDLYLKILTLVLEAPDAMEYVKIIMNMTQKAIEVEEPRNEAAGKGSWVMVK